MKTNFTLLFALVMAGIVTVGQRSSIELNFTAVHYITHVQLDSIKIMNRTQGGETILIWPDTVLSILWVGVPESEDISGFKLYQNYPNPAGDQTFINLSIPEQDQVNLMVTDVLGRIVFSKDMVLSGGLHTLLFTPGKEAVYLLSAIWKGSRQTIKILHYGTDSHQQCSIEYVGLTSSIPALKAHSVTTDFIISPGDVLLFIGYKDILQSGILDSPEDSQTYTFQFATNIPCPGTPTVEYEGQVYNTIQIFSQCWMKENLNVGTMIPGTQSQSNNGTIEKFCYNNEPDSCAKYGGLYQWNEMMQYNTQQGAQGICPLGWHLPTDEEWKVLEGSVDSQYGIGDAEWDIYWDYRGYDAGTNLKTKSGWYYGGNGTDLFGFSGPPGGYHYNFFYFYEVGTFGCWWTSTEIVGNNAWHRDLRCDRPGVNRVSYGKRHGYSVRCLRDEVYIGPIELTFTAIDNTSNVQLDSIKVMNRTQSVEKTLFWPDTTLVLASGLPYTLGDELLYIGYVNTLESGTLGHPENSETIPFQFGTNIPCPGTPMVDYEGQVYNTIQIFSQCWLKENLNVGVMIDGTIEQSNNGTIEKYCYNNEPDSCAKYGGLYQWWEMMQYTTQQSAQGICPPGWHLPTDEEWKVLEGSVDSQYGIGDPEWDISLGSRGYDAGKNLKTSESWYGGINGTDLFGFSGLPGGWCSGPGFLAISTEGRWWASSEHSSFPTIGAWARGLFYDDPEVLRFGEGKALGLSIRCIRDEFNLPTFILSFTAAINTTNIQLDSVKVMNRTQGVEITLFWPDTTLVLASGLPYTPGDELLYIGYADTLESGILGHPEESETITFQFATNIPCPGTPTVEYEGQVYHTIQIFSQCWLKENLNVGVMIDGTIEQSNNGTIEKYCYNNEPDSCAKYGGLYQWWEMMQYTTQQGAQCICPPGWHLPTDEEWKVLEGSVDSQYGIGDPEWDISYEYRGLDAGTDLKTTSSWYENGNGTDLFGFSGLPGGLTTQYGSSQGVGSYGNWWTSTVGDYYPAWYRSLNYDESGVFRDYGNNLSRYWGLSVRCLSDVIYNTNFELTFTAIDNTSNVQLDSVKVMNRTQSAETTLFWPDTTLVLASGLPYTPGDELLCIGYVNTLESGILGHPEESETITFQFATNIPCPGTPTVEYEGQVYNTIQIFSQCWLKENLNVGVMIYGTIEQSNNGTIEKYCYNNEPDSCAKYGGLYQWWEMMQYTTQQGAQGICPPGWHLPTDEEWKVLEGAVDIQYSIGNTTWDYSGFRGYDAGTNLKTTSGWDYGGNGTDLFGFSGLPGGIRGYDGLSGHVGYFGVWWTSTEDYRFAWVRHLSYYYPEVNRGGFSKVSGHSVRCLRDY